MGWIAVCEIVDVEGVEQVLLSAGSQNSEIVGTAKSHNLKQVKSPSAHIILLVYKESNNFTLN